jgi:hypothetical protein
VEVPVAVHPLKFCATQVSGIVTMSGVCSIEPDESTSTEIRFLTGWALAATGNSKPMSTMAVRAMRMKTSSREQMHGPHWRRGALPRAYRTGTTADG